MFSTVQYSINDQLFENKLKMTTPSPFVLQSFLREAKKQGCTYAVIETSSHALFYRRVYGIDYDVAVMTNIAQDHLDLHGTMDNYVATKRKLFDELISFRRKPGVKKTSIVNIDSPYAQAFLEPVADVLYTYGIVNPSAQVRAQNILFSREQTTFEVKMPSNTFEVTTRLRGKFNIYNMLTASCALLSQKVPIETIQSTLTLFTGIPGRMEEVSNNFGFHIFVDYAHTEDSLRSVLEMVREMDGIGRIITIFGATGMRDTTKRPKMGAVVDALSDAVILTDDDTYEEDSLKIIQEVSCGIKRKEGEEFWIVPSREDAIRTGLLMAKPTDVVLIAGKGSESVIVTQKGALPWSDVAVTRKILQEIENSQHSSL